MYRFASSPYASALAVVLLATGCDHGLAPPEIEPPGRIVGTIDYAGTWPAADSVRDLRFVAMRFVPRDTTDFLQLNRMAISDRLSYGVARDSFVIEEVDPGYFFYSGVAHQATPNILSWRPLGLVETGDGIFLVESGRDTEVHVDVDFADPPVFPPPAGSP